MPDEDDNVERNIRTVEQCDGWFDIYNELDHELFIGFYWKEELDDEDTVRYIEAEAAAKREDYHRKLAATITPTIAGGVVEAPQ